MIKTALITLMWCALAARCAAADPAPDTMWSYKKVDGKKLELSVYLPEGYVDSKGTFPTIVIFHGGSWNAGDSGWHYPDCVYWRSSGMIAVSVDYRLKSRDGVEVPLECVKDAKSAVRFLRKNATKLKVDTTAWIDPAFTGSVRNKMQFPRI